MLSEDPAKTQLTEESARADARESTGPGITRPGRPVIVKGALHRGPLPLGHWFKSSQASADRKSLPALCQVAWQMENEFLSPSSRQVSTSHLALSSSRLCGDRGEVRRQSPWCQAGPWGQTRLHVSILCVRVWQPPCLGPFMSALLICLYFFWSEDIA